jgi:hypothetical protein
MFLSDCGMCVFQDEMSSSDKRKAVSRFTMYENGEISREDITKRCVTHDTHDTRHKRKSEKKREEDRCNDWATPRMQCEPDARE